jgi:hypothetical protein
VFEINISQHRLINLDQYCTVPNLRPRPNLRTMRMSTAATQTNDSNSSDAEVTQHLWAFARLTAIRIIYHMDGGATTEVRVHWHCNGSPRGVTWEPIQAIYQDAPEAVIALLGHLRDQHRAPPSEKPSSNQPGGLRRPVPPPFDLGSNLPPLRSRPPPPRPR